MSLKYLWSQLMRYAVQQCRGVSVVEIILSWLIITIILHIAKIICNRMFDMHISWKQELLLSLIMLYMCIGSQITIFRRASGSNSSVSLKIYFGSITGGYYALQQLCYSILNVMLFIPWGMLLGLYRRRTSNILMIFMVTCYSFLTSVLIESTQYVTKRGHFELNDMVTNTLGGFIGAILACVMIAIITKGRKLIHER